MVFWCFTRIFRRAQKVLTIDQVNVREDPINTYEISKWPNLPITGNPFILFQDYSKRLSQQEASFDALELGVAELLPLEVCQQYAPCEELKTECDKLCKKWEELDPGHLKIV